MICVVRGPFNITVIEIGLDKWVLQQLHNLGVYSFDTIPTA